MKIAALLSLLLLGGCAEAAELIWQGKGEAFTRQTPGIYLWWNLGLRLTPGEYQVKAKIRRDKPGQFTISATDAASGKTFWSKSVIATPVYSELNFGNFVYDGSFPLRLSDWSDPGCHVESVSLTPVRSLEIADSPAASCDTLAGWIRLENTAIAIDLNDKKEGLAALKVTVTPKEKRKWYDAGIMRAMPMRKAGMVSFWLKFESEPIPLWVQIFTAETGVAQKLDPIALGIRKGEWKFIELPVAAFMFKPQRPTVENLRALQFSPDEGLSAPVTFLLDDVLIEP